VLLLLLLLLLLLVVLLLRVVLPLVLRLRATACRRRPPAAAARACQPLRPAARLPRLWLARLRAPRPTRGRPPPSACSGCRAPALCW
jgi:hypothetical protein